MELEASNVTLLTNHRMLNFLIHEELYRDREHFASIEPGKGTHAAAARVVDRLANDEEIREKTRADVLAWFANMRKHARDKMAWVFVNGDDDESLAGEILKDIERRDKEFETRWLEREQ